MPHVDQNQTALGKARRHCDNHRVRGGRVQRASFARSARIETSKDPVGAPIFYRDVPLMPPPIGARGLIMPLPQEISPLNAPAYTNLGVALIAKGRMDEAIEALSNSVAIEAKNALAQSNLAAALMEKGRTEEALQHAREALLADPRFTDAHNIIGIALAHGGKLDEAIEHLQVAVQEAPQSLEYRFNLGRVLAAGEIPGCRSTF